GSAAAQAHFLRGVAALHSFWYPVALDEFRASTTVQPDFMMGYWGEAMAHNHPIWGDPQETEAARKVLGKVRITPALTAREQAYLRAVQVLYSEGDKTARDQAYAAAMETIYREYPDDLEAATFYALALLGSIRPEDPAALQIRMRAGAIALEVYRREPNHPGAAHYILHAFDDPDHAILALPAARRYADIAPGAPHALHMPSHIFLQLGMWPEAAASNEASWAASEQWVEHKNLPISKRDYHSLHWLLYVYLQQGRYSAAEELLTLMQKSLAEGPQDDQFFMGYGTFIYASMASAFVVETERWDLATKLFEPLQKQTARFAAALEGSPPQYRALAQYVQALGIFTRGLAAAQQGSPDAQKNIDELQMMEQRAGAGALPGIGLPLAKVVQIHRREIAAVVSAAQGNLDEAIKLMEEATTVEESGPPPSGPPPLIKPSHELFGALLLRAGRPQDAAAQFATALRRQQDRARALIGAARAAAESKNPEAARTLYAKFLRQWQPGNPQSAELREAQDYLKQAGTQTGAPTASSSAESRLANTQWTLKSFGEAGAESPVIDGTAITLKFGADGRAGGSGGCNSYGSDYQVQDHTLAFSPIISTKRACLQEARTQQEQRYFQALESAGQFQLTENHL
ncbi:MAG: META domain-containing protein, partial [Candidatus Binatia bacterium]